MSYFNVDTGDLHIHAVKILKKALSLNKHLDAGSLRIMLAC
jgi:hypothetical protein